VGCDFLFFPPIRITLGMGEIRCCQQLCSGLDHPMATNESLPGSVQQAGSDVGKTVDLIVKTTVILAAVIYGCGFLVISIHQFRYGLVELNPLRPRVLAAGIWFLFFATIPFVLEIEGNSIKSSSPERERWLGKRSTPFFFSTLSCFFLGMTLANAAFDIPTDVGQAGPSTLTILLVMAVSAALVFADQWKRFPHWLAVLGSLGFGFLLFSCGFRDLFYYHHQSVASIALWFMVLSFFAHAEMQSRHWKFQTGNWKQSVAWAIAAVAGFSSIYYPQMKPSWGGGEPVPATIYFNKDSLVLQGRSVSAKIVDETDAGFYVIGGSDKRATFIPRSEVAMVYYSDDSSGPFIMKTK